MSEQFAYIPIQNEKQYKNEEHRGSLKGSCCGSVALNNKH